MPVGYSSLCLPCLSLSISSISTVYFFVRRKLTQNKACIRALRLFPIFNCAALLGSTNSESKNSKHFFRSLSITRFLWAVFHLKALSLKKIILHVHMIFVRGRAIKICKKTFNYRLLDGGLGVKWALLPSFFAAEQDKGRARVGSSRNFTPLWRSRGGHFSVPHFRFRPMTRRAELDRQTVSVQKAKSAPNRSMFFWKYVNFLLSIWKHNVLHHFWVQKFIWLVFSLNYLDCYNRPTLNLSP